mgnify:FL=1
MNSEESFFERDLVLVGAGHTNCLFMKMWAMKSNPSLRVTLINPDPISSYTGMLPSLVAGLCRKSDAQINLFRLCRASGVRLIIDTVERIDKKQNQLICKTGRSVNFDLLSINIGSNSRPLINGFRKFGCSVRPLAAFHERWEKFLQSLNANSCPVICIIGGGLASIELSFAMDIRLKNVGIDNFKIIIFEKGKAFGKLSLNQQKYLKSKARQRKIQIIENTIIKEVLNNGLVQKNGNLVHADFIVSCIGPQPNDLFKKSKIENKHGYVNVDKTLSVIGFQNAFAVGDCANFPSQVVDKSGVYAVRQAPILYKNILKLSKNEQLVQFQPQSDYLKLIVYEDTSAIFLRNGIAFSAKWVWSLKKFIDKNFIKNFKKLTEIITRDIQNTGNINKQMLCGGCGSKVGNVILESSLKKLSNTRSGHIVSEIGDDAAIIKINSSFQTLTTDHLRSFTNDAWLQSKITAIHALGDIWAMGSDPEVALTNIIIPESSNDIQKRTIEEIIDGANSVFGPEGVKIVGGHTSLGKEMVIGFTLGGFSGKRPKTVDKACAGDQIILTKPLGSGVLLAGEMRFEGEGQDLKNLFDEMSKSQSSIAKVLSKAANAMTDITGFGLAGHLLNIISKSNVGAKLFLDEIPIYSGVNNLVARDIRSSIFENNYMYSERMFIKTNANIDILFDPQTSGPLLATVPKGKVKGIIAAGEKLGFECKVIGELTNGRPFIEVL